MSEYEFHQGVEQRSYVRIDKHLMGRAGSRYEVVLVNGDREIAVGDPAALADLFELCVRDALVDELRWADQRVDQLYDEREAA